MIPLTAIKTVDCRTAFRTCHLPAAGGRPSSSLGYQGASGYYWSSSLSTTLTLNARSLYFSSGSATTDDGSRFCGQSVRPVLRK